MAQEPSFPSEPIPTQQPGPRYFTRSEFKRKRSNSDTSSVDKRMHKIIKAMIAQVALGELDKDISETVFPATEVLGIKIPKTYKEAINDLVYRTL